MVSWRSMAQKRPKSGTERISRGEDQRNRILRETIRMASEEGLQSLTIGRMAAKLGMSKSGLFAHFGSKRKLQLATIERAHEIFEKRVLTPLVERGPKGIFRIWILCDLWSKHLETRLFPSGYFFTGAFMSPDSQQIAFDLEAGGHFEIYVVNAEGGRPVPLMAGATNNVTPSWSRDGRWIYFASDRTGDWQTWKIPSAGGQAVQVTKRGGFAAFESFDGKTLYYAKGQSVAGLWEVPVAGGGEKPTLEQLGASLWGYWAPTAEGIYFYDAPAKAIEFFSFNTRKVARVAKPEKPPLFYSPGFAVSPDGRSILFAQQDQAESHIMLVENFRW